MLAIRIAACTFFSSDFINDATTFAQLQNERSFSLPIRLPIANSTRQLQQPLQLHRLVLFDVSGSEV